MNSSANPFATLGAPPPQDDLQGQLQYLIDIFSAFEACGHPRIKPVKRQLAKAMDGLIKRAEAGEDPQVYGEKLRRALCVLRVDALNLLVTVVNQVRSMLKVKRQGSMAPEQRHEVEGMERAFGVFVRGLRKFAAALKQNDAAAQTEAHQILEEARLAMDAVGTTLQSAVEATN
ncbi:MAG: hypothetical protein R3C68_11065 [Myxococcota bacterium]